MTLCQLSVSLVKTTDCHCDGNSRAGHDAGMPRKVATPDAEEAMRAIGQRLRLARTAAGLSQEALSTVLHCDKTLVTHWENGRRLPDPLLMIIACGTLGITLDYLYAGRMEGLPQRLVQHLTAQKPPPRRRR